MSPSAVGTLTRRRGLTFMNDTDRKARRGMMTYVAAILVIACIIAGLYMLFVHPGTPAP